MALTGLVDNTRFLRTDKPQQIQGVNYGNGKLVINGRYDYQPLNSLTYDDETTQICNTNFVSNYARKKYDVNSGTISLLENRFYTVRITGNTTFVLPTPKNKGINNEIIVSIRYEGGAVDFGTDLFIDGDAPKLTRGSFNLYYDFDPLQNKWVVGMLGGGG